VAQGARIQTVCSVLQGDIDRTNLSVTWFKDSARLGDTFGHPEIRVLQIDAYSSMLIIERAQDSHSGNYTCTISNSVDQVSHTGQLIVRGTGYDC